MEKLIIADVYNEICREIEKYINEFIYCDNRTKDSRQVIIYLYEFCTILKKLGYEEGIEIIELLGANNYLEWLSLYSRDDKIVNTVKIIIFNLDVMV